MQAVREALLSNTVLELFATAEAIERNPELLTGADVSEISAKDAAALSETVSPQGLVAVCAITQPTLSEVLASGPSLLVAVIEPNEPGNLGAIIRTADAAGADAVIVDGGADPYSGKAVRASAGSLFHLPVVPMRAIDLIGEVRGAGVTSLATTGYGDTDLDSVIEDGTLSRSLLWLFGSEAHGLPADLLTSADRQVRIPIYGQAESLNLAAAAAVCLYASARAQR